MINPEDPICIDFQASCTKEVAVAKMIGWMRGHIYPESIEITDQDITLDQLPFCHHTHIHLKDQLEVLREKARNELLDALEVSHEYVDFCEQYDAVERIDLLIKRVALYLVEITDEAAKGAESLLRIDQHSTEISGVPHYTLKSVDQWSRKNYDIAILDYPWLSDEIKELSWQEKPEQKSEAVAQEGIDTTSSALTETNIVSLPVQTVQAESDVDEEPDEKGRISRTVSEHIYTSLALAVEAYAATLEEIYQLNTSDSHINEFRKRFINEDGTPIAADPKKEFVDDSGRPVARKYFRPDGRPIVDVIAKLLHEMANKSLEKPGLLKSKQKKFQGQEDGTMRKRIGKALAIKIEKMIKL